MPVKKYSQKAELKDRDLELHKMEVEFQRKNLRQGLRRGKLSWSQSWSVSALCSFPLHCKIGILILPLTFLTLYFFCRYILWMKNAFTYLQELKEANNLLTEQLSQCREEAANALQKSDAPRLGRVSRVLVERHCVRVICCFN